MPPQEDKESVTSHNEQQDSVEELPVSVVGFSLRAPGCSSVPEFAQALKEGKDLTTSNTRYPNGHLGLPPRQGRIRDEDLASFDAAFFNLNHKQAAAMDPMIRIMLELTHEALMDAHIDIEGARGSQTGVYVGQILFDQTSLLLSAKFPTKSGYELVNGANSMVANRISFYYDFRGPSMAIDTACSSSLVALNVAVRDLKAGVINRAIVGGVSLCLNPHVISAYNAFKMLSPSGRCFSFDSRADGYCRSDGMACIVLEKRQFGHGQIVACGTNSDGNKAQGITYPNAQQQINLMRSVYAMSSIKPSQVGYHEAHGTGTVGGDREELAGLSSVYTQPLTIGSVKSNIGHTEGASGLMGLIKILLMYEDCMLYPNCDFRTTQHEQIKNGKFRVLQQAEPWTPVPCGLSNYGFGGSNAFAVIAPSVPKPFDILSNKVLTSTPFASWNKVTAPKTQQHSKFYAIQRSLGNHRPFNYVWKHGSWNERSVLVFVCDGQGSNWNGMGRELIHESPVFRSTIQELQAETGVPLLHLYEDGSQWMLKQNSALGIVSFQLGLIAILEDAGIRPDLFLGHSLGELACSYLAGFSTKTATLQQAVVRTQLVNLISSDRRLDVFDTPPKDGFDYVFNGDGTEKNVYVKSVPVSSPHVLGVLESFSMDGKMVVIGCEADILQRHIAEMGLTQTRVACFNAPKGQTVSGPSVEVERLIDHLHKSEPSIFTRELQTDSIAYHAVYLKFFEGWLRDKFGHIPTSPLPSSWRSTSRKKSFDTEYLLNNISGPVYFLEAIQSLPLNATVIEIGPSSGLLAQIKRTRNDLARIGLIERDKRSSVEQILNKLGDFVPSAETELPRAAATSFEGTGLANLSYAERYPSIWGKRNNFPALPWTEFELPETVKKPCCIRPYP